MSVSVLGARRGSVLTVLAALLAIVAAPLTPAALAHAAVGHLVISEVYGGGNTGATYTHDYVELYNPTDATVPLAGTSIQYRSATNTGTGITMLSGSVAPHSSFLVQQAGGAVGNALPSPDATGTLNFSASSGTVFLADGTSMVTLTPGSSTTNAAVIDLVGYGSSSTFETAAAPGLSNTTAAKRNPAGDDTDNNSADVAAGAPDPQSSGSGQPPTPVTERTIAEIQGTGATSPLAGQTVLTKGVVTASYPAGGFRGFYLQTPGTGGDLDLATHTASDGVFVYAGSLAAASYPALGSYVSVTGPVSEFAGLTEISPAGAAAIVALPDAVEAPKPANVAWPGSDAQRESLEGMLYAPSGDWTVTDVYDLNTYGEVNLARGATPLRTPTDVARPGPGAQAVAAENATRALTLDDGASLNFLTSAKDTPLPWITPSASVRVGAAATFTEPVVVDYRNSAWKVQPTGQLTAGDVNGVLPATFTDTRTAHPDPVAGQLKVASFNVLNYFTETAADWTATAGNTCTPYVDRASAPVTVATCSGDGPRGAWDTVNRLRQQAKIVKAINALGADVLSLEEIENSRKYGANRDAALGTLVDALNADAGAPVWSFVPSPADTDLPALSDQDVIRTAFIYRSAAVEPVGPSQVLVGSAAFANAREPLAQVFKPKGGSYTQQFLTVVNHFKSKGSGSGPDADTGDGQGASNYSRVNQAHALVSWVNQLKASTGTPRVFLTGDFNSYAQEDPMQVLYEAGYTDVGSTVAHEYTYVFDGMVGSLDHVLANGDALGDVRGAAVWNINSVESVAYEYSRHNYNATDFYAAGPFRSSDHDPLLVGFDNPLRPVETTTTASVTNPVVVRKDRAVVTVQVTSPDGPVDGGLVAVDDGSGVLASARVTDGTARLVLPKLTATGSYVLDVRYLGTTSAEPSGTTVTVVVVKPRDAR